MYHCSGKVSFIAASVTVDKDYDEGLYINILNTWCMYIYILYVISQSFDTIGWETGRAFGL